MTSQWHCNRCSVASRQCGPVNRVLLDPIAGIGYCWSMHTSMRGFATDLLCECEQRISLLCASVFPFVPFVFLLHGWQALWDRNGLSQYKKVKVIIMESNQAEADVASSKMLLLDNFNCNKGIPHHILGRLYR